MVRQRTEPCIAQYSAGHTRAPRRGVIAMDEAYGWGGRRTRVFRLLICRGPMIGIPWLNGLNVLCEGMPCRKMLNNQLFEITA